MAVANSANLQITKMDVGVASKETIYNSAVDRIDAVVGGYLAISLADADTDINETQQCSRVLEFTGALGAGRTVFFDVRAGKAKPRDWIIYNHTTGGFALTFKLTNSPGGAGFGSGVSVTNAKKVGLYHTNPAAGGASGDVFKWTTEV